MYNRMRLSFPAALAIAAGVPVLLGTLPAFAVDTANQPGPRTITVAGQGEVKAAPDEAALSAGVLTQARAAAAAVAANTRVMNGVFATLKRLGIPEKSIQTSDFSVTPQYQPDRNGNAAQKITGYQVSNTVTVTVDDLNKLGPALDDLVSSGANSLGSIGFTIRDPRPLLAQARSAAVKDAIERAQTYAKAAGVQVGPILAIGESEAEVPRPLYRAAMAAAPMAAPPIAAGEESVAATVSVSFAIR